MKQRVGSLKKNQPNRQTFLLFFVFLFFKTGFLCVAFGACPSSVDQADLGLPSAGIKGMCHHCPGEIDKLLSKLIERYKENIQINKIRKEKGT